MANIWERDYSEEELKEMYHDSLEFIVDRLQVNRSDLVSILYDLEKAIEDYDCITMGCNIGSERKDCRFKDNCPWLRMHNILTNIEEMDGHRHRSI